MTGNEFIPAIAIFICQAAILAAFPVLLIAVGTRVVNGIQDARLPWTPYIELIALEIGVAGGALVLFYNIDFATLSPDEIFRLDGPWDLTFAEFIATRANPLAYDLSRVLPVPFSGTLPGTLGIVLYLLGGAVVYAPMIRFRSRRAIANGIRNAVIIFGGAYLTVYGFVFFFWLVNKLNFWIFLVLLLAIHMRTRSQPIVVKLN